MVSAAATGASTSEAASRAQASRPRTMSAERAAVLALVVLAIGAASDRLPPPLVVAVPLHGPLESLGEVHPRLPAELRADLLRPERVPAVVAGAVGHVLDQRLVAAGELEYPLDH